MMTTHTRRYDEQTNINDHERLASLVGGGALIAWGISRGSWGGLLTAAAGGALAFRGATGHCHVYQALGIHTDTRSGRNVSVPYELGVRIDRRITIDRPRQELYRFWRNLENLPKFMRMLENVKEIDNRTSHWVVKAPGSTTLQWRAEVINEMENELIGWRSLPGADIDNAGSVHFQDAAGGRGTVVTVELQYNPPGGTIGVLLAKALGHDPAMAVQDDLRRFKQLMETGEIITTDGQSRGKQELAREQVERPASRKGWNRDVVGTASEESFPASDPPSWTPTGGVTSDPSI